MPWFTTECIMTNYNQWKWIKIFGRPSFLRGIILVKPYYFFPPRCAQHGVPRKSDRRRWNARRGRQPCIRYSSRRTGIGRKNTTTTRHYAAGALLRTAYDPPTVGVNAASYVHAACEATTVVAHTQQASDRE